MYIVGLNMAFQTMDKLFLVLDYCPGGTYYSVCVCVCYTMYKYILYTTTTYILTTIY
jgi:hypothetical protein